MTFAALSRTTEAPAVETRDLSKEFRRRIRTDGRFARKRRMPALNGVTFTVARGECVAILGRNGSGKSTLVRLLSTLLLQDGGSARIFGHDAFTNTPLPVTCRSTLELAVNVGVVPPAQVGERTMIAYWLLNG